MIYIEFEDQIEGMKNDTQIEVMKNDTQIEGMKNDTQIEGYIFCKLNEEIIKLWGIYLKIMNII